MQHNDLLEGLLGRPIFPNTLGVAGPVWSVRNNLKMLLNTRRGTLHHIFEYGLPDISTIYKDFPNSLENLRQAIANAIRKYEPRLSGVEVTFIDTEDKVFRAVYLVSAEIMIKNKQTPIEFKTQISSEGKIDIL